MSFSLDIAKFVKKANGNADKVIRKVIIDIGTGVIMMTPVGNPDLWKSKPPSGYVGGMARANWQYSTGLSGNFTNVDAVDPTGAKTVSSLTMGALLSSTGNIHWISNGLPYIERLENGAWSKQAPAGMVKVTLARFNGIVSTAASTVNK